MYYFAFMYSLINYGVVCWGHAYATHLKQIDILTNKAIRIICFLDHMADVTDHRKKFGILTIDELFLKNTAKFGIGVIYKLYHNSNSFNFEFNNRPYSGLRSACKPKQLQITKFKTDYGKFLFKNNMVKVWNEIALDLDSIILTKHKIKNILNTCDWKCIRNLINNKIYKP